MNLREHVMEKVSVVEVTVPAGELLELLDERDALKDRVSMLEFRLGFGVSGPPIVPRGPDVQVNEDGSIYGGSDLEDDEETVTVNVEPHAGDCSCVEVQEAKAVPKQSGFVVDKSNLPVYPEPRGKRWTSQYTVNQVQLAIRMYAQGIASVTIAAQTGIKVEALGGVKARYREQIELLAELKGEEFEKQMASMIRQMEAAYAQAQSAKSNGTSEGQ